MNNQSTSLKHDSVLAQEILEYLDLQKNNIVIDGTLGLGGHTRMMVDKEPSIRVIGFDLDKDNMEEAKRRLADVDTITYVNDNFAHLHPHLEMLGIPKVDKILLDLGICSTHVDNADKGFSFQQEGPLDMRFSKDQPLTAAIVVNTYAEKDLADIFYTLGEEPASRKYARAIVEHRKTQPFETTKELAKLIASKSPKHLKKHPATRIFQALRIHVNQELEKLQEGLDASLEALAPGGRLLVISYHSLEDRIVKQTFAPLDKRTKKNKYKEEDTGPWTLLTPKPLLPSAEEIQTNPRARSAKLRIIQKNI